MVLSDETQAILHTRREALEATVQALGGQEIWYQEQHLQFPGIAHITTDDWGVRVRFESEHWHDSLTLSGRWDIIYVSSGHLGAQYCGWILCINCPYPELGINTAR
jgi:hypothetical protein